MPFFTFKCKPCDSKSKIFVEPENLDKKQHCGACGSVLSKVLNSVVNKKNENPPYQTAQDCINDSRDEVMKELESFKEGFKQWKP